MNDSFLEDLELAAPVRGHSPQNADRHITRRRSQPSPMQVSEIPDRISVKRTSREKEKERPTSLRPKISQRRSEEVPEIQKSDAQRASSGVKEKRSQEEKLVSTAATRTKVVKKKVETERARSSVSSKERKSSPSKENSRPSESSRESGSRSSSKGRERGAGDRVSQRNEIFEVAMLNAVKEIVGTYTKNESTKILRAMQEMYVNSQANLIKVTLQQSEDLANEVLWGKESSKLRTLVKENASLREDLRKALEESEAVKKENAQLKSRLGRMK